MTQAKKLTLRDSFIFPFPYIFQLISARSMIGAKAVFPVGIMILNKRITSIKSIDYLSKNLLFIEAYIVTVFGDGFHIKLKS